MTLDPRFGAEEARTDDGQNCRGARATRQPGSLLFVWTWCVPVYVVCMIHVLQIHSNNLKYMCNHTYMMYEEWIQWDMN